MEDMIGRSRVQQAEERSRRDEKKDISAQKAEDKEGEEQDSDKEGKNDDEDEWNIGEDIDPVKWEAFLIKIGQKRKAEDSDPKPPIQQPRIEDGKAKKRKPEDAHQAEQQGKASRISMLEKQVNLPSRILLFRSYFLGTLKN